MNHHLKQQLINRLRQATKPLPLNQSGQSLIIFAFVFIGLIAFMGLALDLGLVYINRVTLKRAVDAATLAGVVELPSEEQAAQQSINFLVQNGYSDANIYIAGCVQDLHDDFGSGSDTLINLPSRNALSVDLRADDGKALPTDTLTPDPDLFYHYVRSGVADAPSFFIDTRSYQIREIDEDGNPNGADPQCAEGESVNGGGPYGSASKIKVYGQTDIRMNFMQFFGFDFVGLSDEAVAQNSSNLDVAVVMDSTGSMEFDTICYGCWERCDGSVCPSDDKYKDYPLNGFAYPVEYYNLRDEYICANGTKGGNCTATPFPTAADPSPDGSNPYIIMEAELYANNTSIWDPSFRGPGQGYWALQRSGSSATSVDNRPAFVRHHPYNAFADGGVAEFGRQYTQAEAASGVAPRLDYDFMPSWSGDTAVFVRVQGYFKGNAQTPGANNELYWSARRCDSDGTEGGVPYSGCRDTGHTRNVIKNVATNTQAETDGDWQGDNNRWEWLKLGVVPTAQADVKYTLSLYAGGTGYAIDRIIVAEDGTLEAYEEDGGRYKKVRVTSSSDRIDDDDATLGTAQRLAADVCNPIYGLSVVSSQCRPDGHPLPSTSVNNLNDPLFGDLQPIRGSKEAVKAFVNRLDPSLDQVGFVDFDSTAVQMAQLECLQAAGVRDGEANQINNYPIAAGVMGEFDETVCSNVDDAAGGTQPIGFQSVVIGVENATAGGSTDIADGLRRGLHMLGVNTDNDDGGAHANDCDWTINGSNWLIGGQTQPQTNITSHCSRGAAATQVIVLLTDGAPTDGSPGDNDDCKATAINPLPYPAFNDGDNKYRCIMYYAQIAGNNGVIVYTIGLGAGADANLMRAVAQETNGDYYFAPSAAQLNIIFNQILANIYVRLVQ